MVGLLHTALLRSFCYFVGLRRDEAWARAILDVTEQINGVNECFRPEDQIFGEIKALSSTPTTTTLTIFNF